MVGRLQPHLAARQHGEGLRIDAVLFDEDTRGKGFWRVAGKDGHASLENGGAFVEAGRDEMHRAAVFLAAIGKHPGMGVKAPVIGQEGRVDVDHPALPVIDEVFAQDAHEAGEADIVDLPALKDLGHHVFEHVAAQELALRQRGRGDAVLLGRQQARRGGLVGEHADDLGGIVGVSGSLEQRRHVGSATRNEDADLLPAHRASFPRKVTGSSVRAVSWPTMAAVSPEAVRLWTSFSASSGVTATSMPTPQLKVRSISRSLMPPTLESQPKTAGTVTAPRSISAARSSGRTRGILSMKPPPVMCASALMPRPARRAARIGLT